jgi:two-component system, OmpR family, response regulator MtrA
MGGHDVQRQIVVIDDEQGVLDLLYDLLEMEGFTVVCLSEPRQVEGLKQSANPSLFLIDIMLPGTSGIELAEQLRADEFPDTPIIAMSASRFMVNAAKGTGLFQDTISKPFDVNEIVATVERHLPPA